MKLLLTSGGISNDSIHNALVDLLGKPIADCHALYIPTAENQPGENGHLEDFNLLCSRAPGAA